MSFDYDRIASCESRCCIATGDGKGKRKIAGAKDNDRAKWLQHGSDVRLGKWFSARICGIDACIDPRSFFDNIGKKPELVCSAYNFALQSRVRERRFQVRSFDQSI